MLRKLFFNLWYYRNPPWDTGVSPPELLDFIQSHAPGRVLDLGCGTGTNSITLAKYGWQVSGIDFVGRAIRKAQRKARREGVQVDWFVGDVIQLKGITSPFDLILDIGCFHSLPPDGKRIYLRNLPQYLAQDGTYLMYGFFKSQDGSGSGLVESDLDALSMTLDLVSRQDGTERGRRPSVWLAYRRKASRA